MRLSELNFGRVEKDGEFNWLGLTAEEYEGKKVLTFLNDEKYYKEIENNRSITCIVTTDEVAKKIEKDKYGIIISENPRKDFFELHNKLVKEDFYFTKKENKISEKAVISKKATIGDYNIIIEDDVIIEAGVTIYENVTIKKGSIIRSGARVGGNGFEFSRFGKEVLSVEIQNNTCVDRGVFDRTYLGKNVKVDNLVHIAHDVKVGDNTLVVACTLIGGRTRIGKNSYLGPNCTVKNGLVLGENSKVSMGAVVTKNVKDNEIVTGNFAIPHEQFIKNLKKI